MRRKWTEQEIEILKNWYLEHTDELDLRELSLVINRLSSNICVKAGTLGLTRLGRKPKRTLDALHKVNKAFFQTEKGKENRQKTVEKLLYTVKNNHPKGMLGKHHSEEFSKEQSKRMIERWKNMTDEDRKSIYEKQIRSRILNGTLNPLQNQGKPYSRTRGGKREDLNNIYFRSSWESNMARYYNFVDIEWQFEPKIFIFHNIKRGCVSYTPDFYLPKEDRWVEVKGWMDAKSITKLKRFEKYYPEEYAKLEIITGKEYKEFAKYKRLIPGWEDVHVGV